jgi:hypothetical protein|nr:hypothetical protein [Oxalobacteraceae bacterium]
MTEKQDDLTAKQQDYAIFLPAISGFYATYIGKQRSFAYVDAARMPQGIPHMEQLNWLNPQQALFPYRWSLYSAGHADLDLTKVNPKEDMIRNRDSGSIMVADSGGFQIGKGVWPGQWADPRDKAAEKKREQVLKWQMGIANYGMTLDIPTWTFRDPKAAAAAGIHSYQDAVKATLYNNDYWIANRWGETKILNVLQGSNHAEADNWYDLVKGYCDPKKHKNHFNGWGMGNQNMCDVHLVLKRLVTLIHDGLLEPGVHDWMHFLGTSKLEWALLLTAIQRAVRQYHNPNFTISFDCASPFLATANGQLYYGTSMEAHKKWSYHMEPTADHKKYATDGRGFRDAVIQDKIHARFEDSPVTSRLRVSDICYYKPGDLNKVGKEGRTSWDSFSYALLMGHNVWMHIEAVQRANRMFDSGTYPAMMANDHDSQYDAAVVIDRVFAARDRAKSLAIIDDHPKVWEKVIGTRGFTGKRAVSARPMFSQLFESDDDLEVQDQDLDADRLDQLEQSV